MNINDALNLLNIAESASQADIKKAYKTSSLKFHPDRNPMGAKMMIAINAAYDFLKTQGDTVTPQADFNANNYGDELNALLNKLFAFQGLTIEVCGNWVWVGGETKQYSKELGRNGLGMFWAKKKKMWYYRPSDYKSRGGRGSWDMDTIRGVHGSEKAVRTAPKSIAA